MYDVLTSFQYILESKGFIIPDINNVKNSRRVGKGWYGGVPTPIIGGRGCRFWLRTTILKIQRQMNKNAHGKKEIQMEFSQQLFNCDDDNGLFSNPEKLIMVIVV